MKNYLSFLNENLPHEESGQYVIFKDLIDQLGYDDCLKFLNKNAQKKKVFFIGDNFKINDNRGRGWTVESYTKSSRYDKENCIRVIMTDGNAGNAAGLIYLDPIDNYNNKKYKKILNPELDPYGEDDWGFEIIENIKEAKKTRYS